MYPKSTNEWLRSEQYRCILHHGSGVARGGGQGGHGPQAQALEGAPAQLIGANFKKKIRPRQIKIFLLFFFLLVDFVMQDDLPNGGRRRVGLCGGGGG